MIDGDQADSRPEKKDEIDKIITSIRASMNSDIPNWKNLFELKS